MVKMFNEAYIKNDKKENVKMEEWIKSEKGKMIIKWVLCFWGISIILYLPMITKVLPNPDTIWNGLYIKTSYRWEIGLGRWGIWILQNLRAGIINTSFVTLTALLFLSIVAVIINQILGVRSIIAKLLAGILVICTPNVVSTLTYYYCSDMYFLSYLLAVISVYFMIKANRTKKGIIFVIFSVLLLTISIGIYQAYVGVSILLCALYLILMMLNGNKLKEVISKSIFMIVSGAGGVIMYLLVTKIIQNILNIPAVEDRGFASMGEIGISQIIAGIKNTYIYFFEYFIKDTFINNYFGFRKEINILFFVITLIFAVFNIFKLKDEIKNKISIIGLMVLLPICFMGIVIYAPEVKITKSTGVLMLPAMNYIYILLIILIEKLKIVRWLKYISNIVIFITMSLVINMHILIVLSSQTYMQYNMEKTDYVATTIVSKITELDIDTDDYSLCVLGTMEKGNFPDKQLKLKSSVNWITASYGTIWGGDSSRNACWKKYIEQFIGYNIKVCDIQKVTELKQNTDIMMMNNFPENNSIMIVDDVIVVKLSEY